MYVAKLLIDGKDADAAGSATFERINPITGETASVGSAATVADAIAAVDAAQAAFPAWSALGPNARRKLLNAAAAKLREHGQDFAERVSAETGSTLGWGHFNVHFAAMILEEAAAITTQVTGEVIPSDHPGSLSMSVRQAAGVVLGMAPWNAPIILGVRAIAVPLAVGNTVVLKASETCPSTHRLIAEVLIEAGIPQGVINVVTHSAADAPKIVEAMIAHPAVKRVNFTGSSRVGKIIGELSGKYLKPAILELGGKSPLVILDDANIDEAVKAAAFGAFMHQGQICMSTERIIVDNKIADEFIAKFKAKAETLTMGDPSKGNFPLAACVDAHSADKVRSLVADAVAKGGVRVTGDDGEGVFVPPNIVDKVTPAMRLYAEESFGPVVCVIRADGVEDAIRLANDTEYGLSSAVFGRDVGRAIQVARRIEAGICHINSPTVQDEAQMPFGGMKDSGFGRFGGKAGIEAFTETRWMTIATEPRHYPI